MIKMASVSEKALGKRTVFYLKNEAMVGRITKSRLETLASAMGVMGKIRSYLEDCKDADERYR